MGPKLETLTEEERAVVRDEEAWLARVLAVRERALSRRRARDAGRDDDTLRRLRDDAKATSDDDLPGVLHELAIAHRLAERAADEALPDADAPYFAHLRVREGKVVKDYLLGTTNLVDPTSGVRLVDARVAPIAGVFHRHREGDEYEEAFPGRVAEGIVEARRVVAIESGIVRAIFGDAFALVRDADGVMRRARPGAFSLAGGGAGTAVRQGALGVGAGARDAAPRIQVTALLDAEQHAAITVSAGTPLLVLGAAGSGKTTVALHRLVHLAAAHPERMPLARSRVVVPERGLAKLARRLLAPIGGNDAVVTTLDDYARESFVEVFGALPPRIEEDPPGLVTSLKRHPEFFRAIRARAARTKVPRLSWRTLRRELAHALTDRAFLGHVVDASNGTISRDAIEETVRHTMRELDDPVALELATITDESRKRALDDRPLDEGTPDALAGAVDLEDLSILLSLRGFRESLALPKLAQLVLDEAEDASCFELFVLRASLEDGASVTLAGDEAQETRSSFAGWDASLATLGVERAEVRRLATSYRCPRPIAELARGVLGSLAPDEDVRSARDGAPVGIVGFDRADVRDAFLAVALRELLDREPRASVAVVARDAETSARLLPLFGELPDVRVVHDGDFAFEPGLDLTHVDDVKGLEFDYVIVPDADATTYPDSRESRHRLHVATTRASHQLFLTHVGTRTPLVAHIHAVDQ